MKFEEILETINGNNKDSFEELTLIDTSSFIDEIKYNVYVYACGDRYISVKVIDSEEGTDSMHYLVMEAFKNEDPVTKEITYDED